LSWRNFVSNLTVCSPTVITGMALSMRAVPAPWRWGSRCRLCGEHGVGADFGNHAPRAMPEFGLYGEGRAGGCAAGCCADLCDVLRSGAGRCRGCRFR
jgi:hypothetical protein